ncbi:MAG TPA: ABC transporter permease [Candidatus Limnocylindrales bacterium]|jgi:NitT/TauT family transport system permease protein|nr:ABC transporter permease [Candidatus Limnocylindrales bacterium]
MTAAAPSVGVPLPPRPGRAARLGQRFVYYLPAIAVFVGVIGLWELAIRAFDVRAVIVPAPSAIGAALVDNWDAGRWPLFAAARTTLFEAVGGLVIGTTIGLVVAFAVARWANARDAVLPVAVAANAIPIIAIAPIFNAWFGTTNPLSKMMIAALLVFFPVMINVTRGLTQVDPAALELMRSYAASEWAILRKVRVPNALPFFLTALKVATTLSLIGAIVGEYFGGASGVIGRVVVQSASALRFDVTWAAILLGAASGIAFYLIVVALERWLIPWHASVRGEETG